MGPKPTGSGQNDEMEPRHIIQALGDLFQLLKKASGIS